MPGAASQSLTHIDSTCRQTQGTVNLVHGPRGQNEWRRTICLPPSHAQAGEARSTAGKDMGARASGCGVEDRSEKRGVLIFELDLKQSVPSKQSKVAC